MHTTLKKYFGYDSFRPLQAEIVQHVLAKRDALVLMPTGGGKSLCFQLPALLLDGLTIVISPLISLMKDQVGALKANGIAAAFINSTLSLEEIERVRLQAEGGQLKILYLAPERFALPGFRQWLRKRPVSLIAVDEAHCISEWGHDFRPDYRNLIALRNDFPAVSLIALTATATERVRRDIIQQLALRGNQTFISSFNRPNLTYSVRPKRQAFAALADLLKLNASGSSIVYCFSRKGTEALAARLTLNGLVALPYHAGLDSATRHQTQERFIRDEVRIIVATIAFGMGIDKPDVRLIVHYDLPKSIEGFYQETGRAGRDGLPSRCVLFYSFGDTIKHRFFIDQMENADERRQAEVKLKQMVEYCELTTCRRQFLLRYFAETWPDGNCRSCDQCLPSAAGLDSRETAGLIYNPELFEQLRRLRKRLADTRHVPPFVIFGDRSLQDMATYLPQNLTSFARVYGVGQRKLREFGQIFCASIRHYAEVKGIPEQKRPDISSSELPAALISSTHEATLELLNNKLSLADIARRRGLVIGTIINHLEVLVRSGRELDLDYLQPNAARLMRIRQAFIQSGGWALAPVRDILGTSCSYDELRLVRIFLQAAGHDLFLRADSFQSE